MSKPKLKDKHLCGRNRTSETLESPTRHVYGLGPAYPVDGSGNLQIYHTDGLGSVRAITNGSGNVIATYKTDPFGVPLKTTGNSSQPFQFTGQQRDAESGLYDLRARMYDPAIGRFLQRDPMVGATVAPATLNRYAYVENNPTIYSDASGLCRDPGGVGVRYCIETYIPESSVWGFLGDGLGPDPNGGSYRTQQVVYQPLGMKAEETHSPGISSLAFNTPFGSIKAPGAMGSCGAGAKSLALQDRLIYVHCAAGDGLFFGLAPQAAYDIEIRELAGHGQVVFARGTRFPSLEVWQYGGDGSSLLLLSYDASSAGTGPSDIPKTMWSFP